MEGTDTTAVWDDFGQKVDLTARLREILANYPEGTSILKELVQNADDAGATVVKFCIDLRTHGASSVSCEKLKQFQGASLLVFNDSVFTESDFVSISQIGDSLKKTQVGKTGRFGVGFNAVYHLTDLPSFVSGRDVVFFDPHCSFLPNVSAQNPGKKIDFVTNDVLGKHPDQFVPFIAFGCDMVTEFKGTLFRFPLRTETQAKTSKLSHANYDGGSITVLLNKFAQEKTLDLLFLKNVTRVEILHWHEGTAVPSFVASSAITNPGPTLSVARGAFARASAAHASVGADATIDPPQSSNFEVCFFSQGNGGGVSGSDGDTTRQFAVSQALGTSLQPLVTQGRERFGMRLVPWAAVAAELPGANLTEDSDSLQKPPSPTGRAFCFLPLPVKTGLPVHVNGFFELSSNRRDVWHGGDMSGGGAARSEWNEALLREVVSPAYARLLVTLSGAVRDKKLPIASFYNLFPRDESGCVKPWDLVVVNTCALLLDVAVLHSRVNGGVWLSPRRAAFPDFEVDRDPGLKTSLVEEGVSIPDAPHWVLGVLLKHTTNGAFRPEYTSPCGTRRVLRNSLTKCEVGAKKRPRQRVLTLLKYCLSDIADDDPESVASLADVPLVPLADGTCALFEVGDKRKKEIYVPTAEELRLLLGDARDLCVDVFRGDHAELTQEQGVNSSLHADGADDSPQLTRELTTRFESLADSGFTNLKRIDATALARTLLPKILPPVWKSADAEIETGAVRIARSVAWRPLIFAEDAACRSGYGKKSDEGHPSVHTMVFLWKRLTELSPDTLDPFVGWPLFPVLNCDGFHDLKKETYPELRLAPVGSAIVAPTELTGFRSCLSFECVAALGEAGVHAMLVANARDDEDGEGFGTKKTSVSSSVHDELTRAALAHASTKNKTFTASGAGVTDALASVSQARRSNGANAPIPFSRQASAALRAFLLQRRWFGARARLGGFSDAGEPVRVATIKALVIFETYPETIRSCSDEFNESRGQLPGPLTALDGISSLHLPPDECDHNLLCSLFLKAHDEEQAFVLQNYLGVLKMSASVFLKQRVLARLDQLPPAVRDNAMLAALERLGSLSAADPDLLVLLSQTQFVPTASGQLVTPTSLYDPRVPELLELLDASRDLVFPDPDSAFSSEHTLNTLSRLGMRSGVTRLAVLDAARHAELLSINGEFESARKQGLAVLRYLETSDGAKLASASRKEKQKSNSSSSFFSLFGEKKDTKAKKGVDDAKKELGVELNAKELGHESFIEQLSDIAWVPVTQVAPESEPGLPWFDDFGEEVLSSSDCLPIPTAVAKDDSVDVDSQKNATLLPPVASPKTSRPPGDQWLCSSSVRVLLEDPRSSVLFSAFGWRSEITPETLCKQLAALGRKHKTVPNASIGRALAAAVPRIYAALTACINTDAFAKAVDDVFGAEETNAAQAADATEADVTKQGGEGTIPATETNEKALYGTNTKPPFVWVGVGFADATRVAFAGALHLSPYLHVVPADLLPFKPLLSKLGVRSFFGSDDYVELLQLLRDDAGDSHPLSQNRLDMALWVLGSIADRPGGGRRETTKDENEKGLPIPDVNGVLTSSKELRFNDAPWLPSPDGVRLTHAKIPHSTAEALGVQSLRLALLRESSEDIGLEWSDQNLGTNLVAFGQSEPLTTRLRHILDAYSDGPGVISELVQNADDAGASEVRLLLDTRGASELGTDSLLSPKMKTWQGPALLAWNDATFSHADFHNVARIGQDSKVDRPSTAGRFGLGFNAVYHFTDLPSFVSGDYLVLFDPHAAYLPGASAAKPGLKIKFHDAAPAKKPPNSYSKQQSNLLTQFPDQFAGYKDVFGCDLLNTYHGTLFRFPLRTADAARVSEIKQETYPVSSVRELFAKFQESAARTLLFLKNVRKIGVYEIATATALTSSSDEESAGSQEIQPALLYEVCIPAFEHDTDPRAAVANWVAGETENGETNSRKTFLDKLQRATDEALPHACGWMDLDVRTRGGALNSTAGDVSNSTAGNASNSTTGDELNVNTNNVTVDRQRWLISTAIAGGNPKKMSLSDVGRKRGLVPWVGVAARVPRDERDDVSPTKTKGRAFCFLPLPVKTGLPVHVNAYFELSSNRRDVWHGTDTSGGGETRGLWNLTLLRHAVAPAYAALIASAAQRLALSEGRAGFGFDTSVGQQRGYYDLFPGADDAALKNSSPPEPWVQALPPLYALLVNTPCLRALDPTKGSEKTEKWILPKHGVFPDVSSPELMKSFSSGGDLASAFGKIGLMILKDVPDGVANAFRTYAPAEHVQVASPKTTRVLLKQKTPSELTNALEWKQVLALLSYCLSDIDMRNPHGAHDLHDLPLLPLADGTLGVFQIEDNRGVATRQRNVKYVPKDATEFSLFCRGDATTSILDFSLFEKLGHLDTYATLVKLATSTAGGCGNVRVVDDEGLADLLPLLLPSEWGVLVDGKVVGCGRAVVWDGFVDDEANSRGDTSANSISHATLEQLWRMFLKTSPANLTLFEGWPLLPVAGGAKLAPLAPHGPVVRGEGWSESCEFALQALGVTVLHECPVTAIAATHRTIDLYARPASGAGVLDSAVAVAAISPKATKAFETLYGGTTYETHEIPELKWRAAASLVPGLFEHNLETRGLVGTGTTGTTTGTTATKTCSARNALMVFLCQNKWFLSGAPGGTVSGARLDLLRALPLFETFATTRTGGIFVNAFVALDGTSADGNDARDRQRAALSGPFLPPPPEKTWKHQNLLTFIGSPFLNVRDLTLCDVVEKHCGVKKLSAATTLANHVLPALDSGVLSSSYAPQVLDALLHALAAAKSSWSGAVDFKQLTRAGKRYKCVPTNSGLLKQPGALFDPRNVVSTKLLDTNTFFPQAPFHEGTRIGALVELLGVRAKLGAEGILCAARAVESAARFLDADADGDSSFTIAAAKKRGAALLAHLDDLACGSGRGESLPPHDAVVRDPEGPEIESDGDGDDEEGTGTTSTRVLSFWRALVSVSFVPALQKPVTGGMPWPTGPMGAALHPLAPPRATRPPERAWTSSACLRVLDIDAVLKMKHPSAETVAAVPQDSSSSDVCTEDTSAHTSSDASREDTSADTTSAGACKDPGTSDAQIETNVEQSNQPVPADSTAGDANAFTLHPALVTLLGWDTLAVAVVAAQLLALGKAFPVVTYAWGTSFQSKGFATESIGSIPPSIAEALNDSLPSAYQILGGASRDELDAASVILQSTPWLWTGFGFVASTDVATFDVNGSAFEPYLWCTPFELSTQTALLTAFGVRPKFHAFDYARAACALAGDFGAKPLSDAQVALAVALAEAAADALNSNDLDDSNQDDERQALLKKRLNHAAASGTFMLPDLDGMMICARDLTHNDAEWLLNGDITGDSVRIDTGDTKGSPGSTGTYDGTGDLGTADSTGITKSPPTLRFTHASISQAAASKLGARSLRELFAVDQSSTHRIQCPSGPAVRAFLKGGFEGDFGGGTENAENSVYGENPTPDAHADAAHVAIAAAAWDLVAIAETIGAHSVEISLDLNNYPTRSLLQPQLSQYQGPALCVVVTGVDVLDPAELARLLSCAPPLKLRQQMLRSGEGLGSCMRLGDVVLAAGGGRLCVFDPAGVALGGEEPNAGMYQSTQPTEKSAAKVKTGGSAKSFSYHDGALPKRFADQFAPFVTCGWSPTDCLTSDQVASKVTYLRVPLRTSGKATRKDTALAPIHVDPGDAKHALSLFAAQAHKYLLFSASLKGITCRVRNSRENYFDTPADKRDQVLADIRIKSPSVDSGTDDSTNLKVTPATIDRDAEWRRSTLSSFFGGTGNSTKCAHVVELVSSSTGMVTEGVVSMTDLWIVGATIGVGKARDIALDRTRDARATACDLLPLAQCASHIFRDGVPVDPSNAPPTPAAAYALANRSHDSAVTRHNRNRASFPEPGSGLFALGAPCAYKRNELGKPVFDDPVASALSKTPGVVSAHFAVRRGTSAGRAVEFVDPRLFAAGDRSNAISESNTTESTSGADASTHHTHQSTPAIVDPSDSRREWNRALCACVVSANVAVVTHARRIAVPSTIAPVTFYGLWPLSKNMGVPPPPKLDPNGLPEVSPTQSTHPAATLFIRPLYKALTEQTPGLFLSLGKGDSVKPQDGFFLPAGFTEGVSFGFGAFGIHDSDRQTPRPLAARFIATHFPVIDAPSDIRPELAAACPNGVTSRELTAGALRLLLKKQPPPTASSTLSEADALATHVELLECAASDVWLDASEADSAASGTVPGNVSSSGQTPRPTPPTDSLTSVIDSLAAAGVPVNEWLGAAGLGNASAATPDTATAATNDQNSPPINLAAARDLRGVPVPTANGCLFALGSATLYHATAGMASLVPRLSGQFIHPNALRSATNSLRHTTLHQLFSHPGFNAATATREFTVGDLLADLPRSLPVSMHPGKLSGAPVLAGWVGPDKAPTRKWIESFWEVTRHSGDAADREDVIDKFGEWPLVPLAGGKLLCVKHRACVFVPPPGCEDTSSPVAYPLSPSAFDASVDETETSSVDETDESDLEEDAFGVFARPTDARVAPEMAQAVAARAALMADTAAYWRWAAPALRMANFPVLDKSFVGTFVDLGRGPNVHGFLPQAVSKGDYFAWRVSNAIQSGVKFDFANLTSALKANLFDLLVVDFNKTGTRELGESVFLKTALGLNTVRQLPVFPLASFQDDGDENDANSRIALTNADARYATVAPDAPFAASSYSSKSSLLFVETALPLYHALGVALLDDVSLLSRHVVPKLPDLDETGRAAVLAYILRHWPRLKDADELVAVLKGTKFVETGVDNNTISGSSKSNASNSTSLRSPGELYDPEVELLAGAFRDSPEAFPAKLWRTKQWLAVLRRCGLRSAVDAVLFTECATRVASRAMRLGVAYPVVTHRTKDGSRDVFSKYPPVPNQATIGVESLLLDENIGTTDSPEEEAGTLLAAGAALSAHLVKHMSVLFSVSFCETLSLVPFVPASFGIPGTPGPMGKQCNVLVSFANASAPKLWAKVFMARPVIPAEFVPPQFARNALRFNTGEPTGQVVLEHLLCLGSNPSTGGGTAVLTKWPNGCNLDPVAAVKVALGSIARAVAENDFSPSEIQKLRNAKFVPVENGAFCEAPCRLFVRLPSKALQPLRFEVPSLLVSEVETLRLLGTKDVFGVHDAAGALADTFRLANGISLSPNEITAAVAALRVAAGGGGESHDLRGDSWKDFLNTSPNTDGNTASLFAPDALGVLRPPSDMLHAWGASDWLTRIAVRNADKLTMAHHSIDEGLCKKINIRSLNAASREERVTETFDEALFSPGLPEGEGRKDTALRAVDEVPDGQDRDTVDAPCDLEGAVDAEGVKVSVRDTEQAAKNVIEHESYVSENVSAQESNVSSPSTSRIVAPVSWPDAVQKTERAATQNFATALFKVARGRVPLFGAFLSKETLHHRLVAITKNVVNAPSLKTRLEVSKEVTDARNEGEKEMVFRNEKSDLLFAGPPTKRAAFFEARTGRVFLCAPSTETIGGTGVISIGTKVTLTGTKVTPIQMDSACLLAPVFSQALFFDEKTKQKHDEIDRDAFAFVSSAFAALVSAKCEATMLLVAAALAPDAYHGVLRGYDDFGNDDVENAETVCTYEPGTIVPNRDVCKLRVSPLRPVAAGEVCALRLAVVTSASEAASTAAQTRADGVSPESATQETYHYVYAKALSSARPTAGDALQSVLVETLPGVTATKLTSEVFTFALVAELPKNTNNDDSAFDVTAGTVAREAFEVAEEHDDALDVASTTLKNAKSVTETPTPAPGPSPEIFAKAVSDLLSAHGSPLPSDQRAMLVEHQRLRQLLKSATEKADTSEKKRLETVAAAVSAAETFLCPITQSPMSDPVIAADGHTYERTAIERWFGAGRLTSPVTNEPVTSTRLLQNHTLKSARAAWEDAGVIE